MLRDSFSIAKWAFLEIRIVIIKILERNTITGIRPSTQNYNTNNFIKNEKGTIMLFEEKLKIAFQELEDSGIRESSYKPLTFRFLWIYGFKIRPPHYRSFIKNFISSAVVFAFFWAFLMGIVAWRGETYPIQQVVNSSIQTGSLIGLAMSCLYKYGFRKYKLTKWKNLSK